MINHTKGPWTFREQGDANQYVILDADGHWLASLQHNGEPLVDHQRANLALMTAAPDLLAALEEVLDCAKTTLSVGASMRSRAAIAKAKEVA